MKKMNVGDRVWYVFSDLVPIHLLFVEVVADDPWTVRDLDPDRSLWPKIGCNRSDLFWTRDEAVAEWANRLEKAALRHVALSEEHYNKGKDLMRYVAAVR